MNRKIAILTFMMVSVVFALYADFPVFEFYGSSLINTWEQFWTVDGTLESVAAGTDGIADPTGGDGYFGRSNCNSTGATTSGNLTGNLTDTNYNLKTQVYTHVVNEADGLPRAYWYQMLVFYRDANGYGRFHTHFNQTALGTPASPRIRLQITNPAFVYTLAWASPTDFTAPTTSSWHEMKVEISGTTALCYFDGVQLAGTADWTSAAPTRSAGKFGFGQYIDGADNVSTYLDQFKAYQGAEPPAPTPTQTPTPTPIPLSVESQNWTIYE
jgi:hypothetical protein